MGNGVNRCLVLFLIIIGILTIFSGCVEKKSSTAPTPIVTPTITSIWSNGWSKTTNESETSLTYTATTTPIIKRPLTPIWNITDLEVEKLERERPIYIYIHKITKRSMFSKDIEFKAGYPPGSFEKPLFYDFGDFINYFVYYGTAMAGAQTYNKEGHLLAEASIRYFISGKSEQGIEVEEIHYAGGEPIFKSKSLIDPYTGEKIKLMEEEGKKVKDYYFIYYSTGAKEKWFQYSDSFRGAPVIIDNITASACNF